MSKLKSIFKSYLDKENYRYTDLDPEEEDSVALRMSYELGEQPGSADYWIFFNSKDGLGYQIGCILTKIPEEKLSDCYALCNELNSTYRYVKVFVDTDRDLHLRIDEYADENCVIGQVFSDIHLLNDIIPSEIYPKLMKMIWA